MPRGAATSPVISCKVAVLHALSEQQDASHMPHDVFAACALELLLAEVQWCWQCLTCTLGSYFCHHCHLHCWLTSLSSYISMHIASQWGAEAAPSRLHHQPLATGPCPWTPCICCWACCGNAGGALGCFEQSILPA